MSSERIQAQELALSLVEQGNSYRITAEKMNISEGAVSHLLRSARKRLAQSPRLTDRLRVDPDWFFDNCLPGHEEEPLSWSYTPNIPEEVVWVNAWGSQITATEEGYLVEAPFVEVGDGGFSSFFQPRPGQTPPQRPSKLYESEEELIDALPAIEAWRYPVSIETSS
ncbi:hypothetical protein [Pseudarthrobacter sp. PS3-L1]|uniref:hypothetical protein n=1 Tax=Pseudarthrobacter sp. PS3-L1 TaxID=3046207 RepID=UPI0024BB9360|nr:hypothetical protein [Pseudarthrobacter sp. PS3-L1]MDJ0322108.1 hypothetical protein [Pseudarthrobacter sp. PS3-L1]